MCAPVCPPNILLDLVCMLEIFSKLQAESVQLCGCCSGFVCLFVFPLPSKWNCSGLITLNS